MDGTIVALIVILGGLIVVGVLIGLVGLALGLVGTGINGALRLLAFASEQGFIGIAVYAACWFFMLPLMLIASVIVGMIASGTEEQISSATSPPSPEAQAAQWQEEDRQYPEQKQKLIERAPLRGEYQDS